MVKHIIDDLKSIGVYSEDGKTQSSLEHIDRWVGGEFGSRGYKYGIFIEIEDSSEFFIVLPDSSIATVSCDMCANAWELICEQNSCGELFETQIYEMGEIVEDEDYSVQFMDYNVFSSIIEIIRESCGGYNDAMEFNESKMNGLKRLISESVKKTIDRMIKEGTPYYDDGMFDYMGTGSPESKERIDKIRRKKIGHHPINRHDWEREDKSIRYDSNLCKNVYGTAWDYTTKAYDILKELQTKLEKVEGHNDVKQNLNKLMDDVKYFCVRNNFKRYMCGTPNPYYNENEE